MTLKKTLLTGALLATVPFVGAGCDGFLDVNDDPNVAGEGDVPDGLLFTSAVLNYGASRTIEVGPGGNFFAQYWSSSGSAGVFLNPERYTISPFTTNNWFRTLYTDALSNLSIIVDQAESATVPRPAAAGQAKVMLGMTYLDATISFGAVPFTEALQGREDTETALTPKYDDQLVVLRGIADLMDEAIADLAAGGTSLGRGDVIYDNDLTKWRRFASSVKLNALVLLRAGGQSVDSEIDALIANNDLLIRSNVDNALLPFDGSTRNPYFVLLDNFASGANAFLASASTAVDLMNDLEDPRRATYINPRANGTFEGAVPGTNAYGSGDFVRVETLLSEDTPERLMTADQTLLLVAEYLADKGRIADAQSLYEAGIRASFEYWSRDGVGTSGTWDFNNDGFGQDDGTDVDDYIASLTLLSDNSDDNAVNKVQQQLYIAMFGRGLEGWTLARRGDPEAGADDDGFIQRTVPIDVRPGLNGLINRYPYPVQETTTNPNTPRISNDDLLLKMPFQTPGSNL